LKISKNDMRVGRLISKAVGAVAIVAAFFFGTLFILDHRDAGKTTDDIRAEHAKLLKDALELFKKARGSYPVFVDNPVDDLKKDLVEGNYLRSIPIDPSRATKGWQYRYSSDGKAYGLLFSLEFPRGKIPSGDACLTGVGTSGAGFWGHPPDCPF
jgi:hypothetical protein